MRKNYEDVIDVVACELRLGPGEDDVYRYENAMPKYAWAQLNKYAKIAYRDAAIDIMMQEINEFISARRDVHRILNGLKISQVEL